ncbi:MAG: hypothetical protein AAGE52_12425, partial [Myxococcota bacterium]
TGMAPDRASVSRIQNARIANNQGPGIASTGLWRLTGVTVSGNFGPGVLIAPIGDTELPDASAVEVAASPMLTRFDGNIGPAIEVVIGTVRVLGNAEFEGNGGAGVLVRDGSVFLNTDPRFATTSLIRQNGSAGCRAWSFADGEWTGVPLDPCDFTAGVVAEIGNITATNPRIRENAGAGVIARDPDSEGLGVVTINGGEVCANGAADEGETLDLTSVDTSCS